MTRPAFQPITSQADIDHAEHVGACIRLAVAGGKVALFFAIIAIVWGLA